MPEDAESLSQQPPLSITDQELFDRLGWFTRVRWALGLFCLLVLLVSWHVFGVRFRSGLQPPTIMPAVGVVLMMFLYNAVFVFLVHIVRARGRITHRLMVVLALLQICCDMIALCGLIYYTGGVENYFVFLILVPLVVAPALLGKALAYVTAGVAALLVNVLAWGQQQGLIPHVQALLKGAEPTLHGAGLYADPVYVLQVTVASTATIFAIVFVASSIAARLRSREAELESAHARLRLVDEAKGFFMRKAGHEMRAPLAAILSILEAVGLQAPAAGNTGRQLLDRARQRTRALMSLVDDLRRYSRLRSPQGVLHTQPLQLGELVTQTVELFRQQAADAQVSLECHAQPLVVEGEEELLAELLTNLVANALQYTPAAGEVEVALRQSGSRAVLTVADTGIGLSRQASEHIFEEFYRASEARNVFPAGTGLGLAICKRVVDMHGGEISASNRPGGGTVFTVSLPLAATRPGGERRRS